MLNSVSLSTNKDIYILQEQLKRLFDCLKYIPVNYSHFFQTSSCKPTTLSGTIFTVSITAQLVHSLNYIQLCTPVSQVHECLLICMLRWTCAGMYVSVRCADV